MIELQDLTKRYGDLTALDGVSFKVEPGEVVGFLGVNGAGKSTTLRILSGFIPATSGTARLAGHDVFRDSLAVRRSIGYLPETVPLYPELRVSEYLGFRARIKGVPGARRAGELDRVLELCKLGERRRQTIGTLSRGLRQRVGLADALLGPPQILLLDEPTSGLDPLQRLEVRALLNACKRQHTVLLSTHILSEVEATCHRVLILHRGRLVPDEEVARLRQVRRFTLAFAGPEAAVLESLRGLKEVERAEAAKEPGVEEEGEGAQGHAELEPRESQDPRDALVSLFAARRGEGWRLLELRRRTLSLEEIFARATGDAEDRRA
ncbi:MAG: ABC transporter ATP-binding protein [Planctomycetota bacterium]|nr:ABC transporter ATP-binding protein [Planctomycetota bacterium]